ncbi:putative amidohydrolase YtcJ [Kribbella aluminosa]|uniref:Amidohydrolase YtcJ n=1 Tax=Kribbella aluminosa TaxID=416017 RepID=A0ABS4UK20_9ACTN|nr:amidohydrolase family protein [Kribbella aluminosa]MBP2352002.1 putative amidohydrolase YtcJ [Kribbella aluminosa]
MADILLREARILNGSAGLTWVAVTGGSISAVGHHGEPEPPAERVVDLDGAVLLPGFVDSHTHLGWSAEDRWTINWSGTTTHDEALDSLRTVAARVTPGDWVTGGDWLPSSLPEPELPTLGELDQATDGRPLFLRSLDHSIAILNTVALQRARIDADTADPAGGRIERYDDGAPTGVLRGTAIWSRLAAGVVPPPNRARRLAELRDLLADLSARGITEVHDIATYPVEDRRTPIHLERSFTDLGLIDALAGELPLRYSFRPSIWRVDDYTGDVTAVQTSSPLITFAGFKMSLDNGWYSEPGGPRIDSFRYPGAEEAGRLGKRADAFGAALSIHAMGDLGVAEALDVLSGLPSRAGTALPPHRVIHARRVRREDVVRLAALGVAVEVQPWEIVAQGPVLAARGGDEFQSMLSPYRALLDAGVVVTIGSDRRLGLRVDQRDTDPLVAVQLAVTREGLQPEQRITVTEALACATTSGAIAAGAGGRRGKVAVGYDADLVALGDDPRELPPERIADARPVLTMSAGRLVFGGGER